MADILLISAPSSVPINEKVSKIGSLLPYGVGAVASVLAEHGFDVAALDLSAVTGGLAALDAALDAHRPRIVGLSAVTNTYRNALRLARAVKQRDSRIVTIIGGPHVTFTAADVLADPAIDVVVHHEGEMTALALADHVLRGYHTLDGIEGISYRGPDGAVRTNPERAFIRNLDEVPFIAREIFRGSYSAPYEPLVTSRGCPFQCTFCSASAFTGHTYRMRSPANVIDEIVYLQRRNIHRFNFSDDTLTASPKRVRQLCALISALGLRICWASESRVDVVTREFLAMLAQHGCTQLQFGVESGDQAVLDSIHKRITVDEVEQAVRWAFDAGLMIICSMMIGHPADTKESVARSIELATRLEAAGAEVRFHVCTPYPGTYLWEHAEELGLRFRTLDFDQFHFYSPVYDTPHLTAEDIRNLHFTAMQAVVQHMHPRVAELYSANAARVMAGGPMGASA